MEDFERTAETTAEGREQPEATAGNDAGTAEDAVSEAMFEDGNGLETGEDALPEESPEQPSKQTQSKQERSLYAQKRREAEQKERELQEIKRQARFEAIRESLDGKNPYNNEPIEDEIDMQMYLDMKEIEKSGGDPVMDYAKFISQKKKDAAKASEDKNHSEGWFTSDRENFHKAHPEVTDEEIEALIEDKTFNAYAGKLIGKVPLTDIYEGYTNMKALIDAEARQKAERLYAKKISSPNSLGGTEYVPKKSVSELNDSEIEEMIAKAKRGEFIN